MDRRNAPPPSHLALLALAGVLSLLVAAAAWHLAPRSLPAFQGTTFMEVSAAPDFALVDESGRRVTLADYRGTPVALFFGFTHCPDVCPLTLRKLARARERARLRPEQLPILLVTVDPERDTPEVLADYVRAFGGAVHGLTGTPEALEAARAGYGAYVEVRANHAGHRSVVHSAPVYGIDRDGNLQVVISDAATDEETVADLRALARR